MRDVAVGGAEGAPPSLDWADDAALIDGTPVSIRPLRPGDRPEVQAFFAGLSPETLRLRYFVQHQVKPHEMDELTHSDATTCLHLGAFHGEVILGVAAFRRTTASAGEVSFLVCDAFQGRGLGSLLLLRLATAARVIGIRCFVALTLEVNERMLGVFCRSGYPTHVSAPVAGVVTVLVEPGAGSGLGVRGELSPGEGS